MVEPPPALRAAGCAAMLQGPMRLWRGRQYKAALDAYFGSPTHELLELPGVPHDAYEVARAPGFLAAAFEGWPGPPQNGSAS